MIPGLEKGLIKEISFHLPAVQSTEKRLKSFL
jgi:hypothetical protein